MKRWLHKQGFRSKTRLQTIDLINQFFNSLSVEDINDAILGKIGSDGERIGGFLSRLNTVHHTDGASVQAVTRKTRVQMPAIRNLDNSNRGYRTFNICAII